MIIYVFSDSHGSNQEMIDILAKNPPDAVIHLGDGHQDAKDASYVYDNIPFYMVPGNCDFQCTLPPIQSLTLEDTKLLFSHGHHWQVKQRLDIAQEYARQQEAQILLFGHTHIPLCEDLGDLWMLNPGPAPESYGIIQLNEGEIYCSLKKSY